MKFFNRLFNVWEYGTFTYLSGFPTTARRRARTGEIQLEYFISCNDTGGPKFEWHDILPTQCGTYRSDDGTFAIVTLSLSHEKNN